MSDEELKIIESELPPIIEESSKNIADGVNDTDLGEKKEDDNLMK